VGGKLDVLAYNRDQKCFHVAEGKYANRIASVGHAIGQVIAYISMLQEGGFDFLNRISKEANLYLTDFTDFLENKSVNVCFYVVLPEKQRDKISSSVKLVLDNIGDFGQAIGIMYASKKKCVLEKVASPIKIKIRRRYSRADFFSAISGRFLRLEGARNLCAITNNPYCLQFKEKHGNPYLHFEVWPKRVNKKDKKIAIEVGFHLEWAGGWLKHKPTLKRANKIRRAMQKAARELKNDGLNYRYLGKWGKAWSKVFTVYQTQEPAFYSEDLDATLGNLLPLANVLLPLLNKMRWGRRREKKGEIS
jgi:hypothetical protein